METILIENAITKGPKDSSTPKPTERHERNTLHALQESAKGNVSVLGGKECLEKKKDSEFKPKVKILFDNKNSSTSSNRTMKIYEDNNSSTPEDGHTVRCSRSVQTEDALLDSYIQNKQLQNVNVSTDSGHLSGCFDQEAYDLMVNEDIPENYWKDLAEQRRQALNDTLEENEKLFNEVEQLKEENRRLSNISSKVEYLENLLQDVLSDDADSDDISGSVKAEPKSEPDSGQCSFAEPSEEHPNKSSQQEDN